MVQNVIEVRPEYEPGRFPEPSRPDRAAHRQVEVEQAGTAERVPSRVSRAPRAGAANAAGSSRSLPPCTGTSRRARSGSIRSARGLGSNCPPPSGTPTELAYTVKGNPDRIAASSASFQPRSKRPPSSFAARPEGARRRKTPGYAAGQNPSCRDRRGCQTDARSWQFMRAALPVPARS